MLQVAIIVRSLILDDSFAHAFTPVACILMHWVKCRQILFMTLVAFNFTRQLVG